MKTHNHSVQAPCPSDCPAHTAQASFAYEVAKRYVSEHGKLLRPAERQALFIGVMLRQMLDGHKTIQ